ncbi:hypothetical protein OAF53_00095 [Akkermansiaceae bacterium]|nr:hypothetical protein [Akkermansiaceae bacterium]
MAFLWVILLGWMCVSSALFSGANRYRQFFWTALVVLQLAPLFYFKYWKFVLEGILGFEVATPHTLIPMGLSFYTFQVISVCLDSKKQGMKPPRFIDYFNFASFFPQIVAGPIERRRDLLPQVEKLRLSVSRLSIEKAIPWIVLGLFYKMVLADNLALLSNALQVNTENGYHIGAEVLLFSLRIYFDFAGYSFVALGLGALFGITLTMNFVSPYWSTGLKEFWRRWHVTLSQWLRDYVYFALGGSKRGILWLNLLLTFIISGIWHGAGWNFLLWGLAHGIGLVICNLTSKRLRLPRFLGWCFTLGFVFFTWLFFYETNIQQVGTKTTILLDPRSYLNFSLTSITTLFADRAILATAGLVVFLSIVSLSLEGLSLRKDRPYSMLTSLPVVGLMVVLLILLTPVEQSTFIYFNF